MAASSSLLGDDWRTRSAASPGGGGGDRRLPLVTGEGETDLSASAPPLPPAVVSLAPGSVSPVRLFLEAA